MASDVFVSFCFFTFTLKLLLLIFPILLLALLSVLIMSNKESEHLKFTTSFVGAVCFSSGSMRECVGVSNRFPCFPVI